MVFQLSVFKHGLPIIRDPIPRVDYWRPVFDRPVLRETVSNPQGMILEHGVKFHRVQVPSIKFMGLLRCLGGFEVKPRQNRPKRAFAGNCRKHPLEHRVALCRPHG
ncbi:hypothetical protein AAC387_Pa10g0993 [Persea americana]